MESFPKIFDLLIYMFPELIFDKIHFYIWKYNFNKCNKEYIQKIDNTDSMCIIYNHFKIFNFRLGLGIQNSNCRNIQIKLII